MTEPLPFPTPYPALLGDDPLLGTALETALGEVQASSPGLETPFRAPISIAAVSGTQGQLDFAHAGLHFGDTHFSASLLKVAAMYAAYELVASANRIAPFAADAANLFAQLHSQFDDPIDQSVPLIAATPGITRAQRLPAHEQVLAPAPLAAGGLLCSLRDDFLANMHSMMFNSSNDGAAACIQALGYSWINGALQAGGFFFPPAQSGVWLAGTFTGALTPVFIPSSNDGLVAQATTTFDLASMIVHILNGTLVDASSSGQMLAILATTASVGANPSFMDFTRRPTFPPRSFTVTHTKIGQGPLKTGESVASEGSIVEHADTGRQFVVVWQNSLIDLNSLFAMGSLVEKTIEHFLFGG